MPSKMTHAITAGLAGCLWLPLANATTGLSALGALWDLLLHAAYLGAYLIILVLLLVFVGGRRTKVAFIVVFIAGLLFMPPFQYKKVFSIHYVNPVNNLPEESELERIKMLNQYMLTLKDGRVVLLNTRFGGNVHVWGPIAKGNPVGIEKAGNEISLVYYAERKDYEYRNIQKKKFGKHLILIPLIAHDAPMYRVYKLEGRLIEPDWKATDAMLYEAAASGAEPSWVRELIERGAGVGYVDPDRGDTALHRAIDRTHAEVADILMDAGAQMDTRDINGLSPLDLLLKKETRGGQNPARPRIEKMLMQFSGQWRVKDEMLIRAMHSNSDPAFVEYLLKNGASVNHQGKKFKNTALLLAVVWRQYDTADVLIRAGARSKIPNKAGQTARDFILDILESPQPRDDLDKVRQLLESLGDR